MIIFPKATHFFRYCIITSICLFSLSSCTQLLETAPENITDTSDITITCDASQGNKGLYNYEGDVYVHIGLITDKSESEVDWQYVKFKWGSTEAEALATPVSTNRWSYSIINIREYFGVAPDEQIKQLAILFRSGDCDDIYCKVLRNDDGGDMYIPIHDESFTVLQ